MERSKPLSWMVFIGCILTMMSLLAVFGLNLFLLEPGGTYSSQPLANLAGIIVLLLGIILVYAGSRKAVTPFAGVSYVRLASVAGSVRRGREAS